MTHKLFRPKVDVLGQCPARGLPPMPRWLPFGGCPKNELPFELQLQNQSNRDQTPDTVSVSVFFRAPLSW